MRRALAIAMTWLPLAACALTSRSAPRELRYFSPEPADPAAAAARPAPQPAARPTLRLGRVWPAAHLRYEIVHRDSGVEVQPYETLRWTEPPDAYVRRALSHALFETHAIDQVVGGPAPTLDVEVVAFEEIVRGSRHSGRVELRYQLHDDARVLARGTVAVERDAAGPQIEAVVAAIGAAMEAATAQLADRMNDDLAPP